MELFTPVPPLLLSSCLLSLCPIFLQEGFWILLSVTFPGSCSSADCKPTLYFPDQHQPDELIECFGFTFSNHVQESLLCPTTVWISDLVSRKGALPFLYPSFVCESSGVLFSLFFLPIHLALLSFLTTAISKPAVTSNHCSHGQPDTLSSLEGATKPFKWSGFSHLLTNRSALADFRNNSIKDRGSRKRRKNVTGMKGLLRNCGVFHLINEVEEIPANIFHYKLAPHVLAKPMHLYPSGIYSYSTPIAQLC